jgi:NADPH-dependent 7-cyano-7-deazaguanine reductase QueF
MLIWMEQLVEHLMLSSCPISETSDFGKKVAIVVFDDTLSSALMTKHES